MHDDAPAGSLADEQIIARVLDGDRALFELIMRRYNARLFRTARAILRNEAEAEDAVQQAYISAYEHLGQFHGDARFSTWLTRIAIRAAQSRLRSVDRRGEVDLAAEKQEDIMSHASAPADNPEENVARGELAGLIERAIDQLPEPYRVVFMLREVQQLSTAESAECLEVTEEVIKVRLHRAKTMLREVIASNVETATAATFVFLGARCDAIVARVMQKLETLPAPHKGPAPRL